MNFGCPINFLVTTFPKILEYDSIIFIIYIKIKEKLVILIRKYIKSKTYKKVNIFKKQILQIYITYKKNNSIIL